MGFPAKLIRSQLNFFKPFVSKCTLETTRKGQDKIGELMESLHRKDVIVKDHHFTNFYGAWVIPKDERRSGVILYLHGGGYTCGDLDYAKGFGSTLAAEGGCRVFCAAYRLAPEFPFPAALEDAVESYRYLLKKGYSTRQIMLCGESAGGGLIFALCLRLRQLSMPLPCGLIAISPWVDLTASGKSYQFNRENDPSLTEELLDFYASCYTKDRLDALVSPLFGDLKGFPPSLIFAGGDEILLDDARALHEKLRQYDCISNLHIAPERWHAYVLYQLNENMSDFDVIDRFLNTYLSPERKLRWMRLDNAAKIYPAARRRNWSNVFRVSATLKEPVDRDVLQSALDITVRRFPYIAVRLRHGFFWYYLEQISHAPEIQDEDCYPLVFMTPREIHQCAFRVLVYQNRIAVELFHALSDGTGALVFLKTLVAEYLTQKYGIAIPAQDGVLGRLEAPSEAELEDSFLKYAGTIGASRQENTAYHLSGTRESDDFKTLTTFMLDVGQALSKAAEYHVTLTEFLCAAMMRAILVLQEEKVHRRKRRKPVKILLPVNLRRLFPSTTMRNFSLFTTTEVDPRLGDYTFAELCSNAHHRLGMDVNAKQMRMRISTNVKSESSLLLKIMPLFVKNLAMKAVFDAVGECKSCLCLSNMGQVKLPEPMEAYVQRMDFIIGVPAQTPYNCAVLSYGNTLIINMIRNIREPELERHFYAVLREQGLHVKVESNQR
jgi:acetyl esterase/lipase/NRPS condensation-like uncharacterized protein